MPISAGVGRAALTILSLGVLVVSGWTFVRNGGQLHKGGSIPLLSGTAAADVELQTAATSMLEAKAAIGSYAHTDLHPFHNLVVAYADDNSYCLQLGSGSAARHLAGPSGVPAPGPC
jgi:hypothetical protein